MTIQPLASRPREISVTEAIEPAYEQMKRMLFRPFDFGRWIIIGFCAWLATLGETGGSSFPTTFSTGSNNSNTSVSGADLNHYFRQTHDYALANLDWLVPVVVFLILLALAIGLVILWLNCRGKFMFLHCVAGNRAEVDVPWREHAGKGHSLFLFRIGLSLVGMVLCVPLLVVMAWAILNMILAGQPNLPGVLLAVGMFLGMLLMGIPLMLIRKFTMDFVVPIMFLRGGTCLAAWREFWGLLTAQPGQFILYLLFQIVIGFVVGAILLGVTLVTCCVAGCIMALPFIGTVVQLPILIFQRAYSLHFLAQFGPQYDVFPAPPAPPQNPPADPSVPISPLGPVPS